MVLADPSTAMGGSAVAFKSNGDSMGLIGENGVAAQLIENYY